MKKDLFISLTFIFISALPLYGQSINSSSFQAEINSNPFKLKISDNANKVLLETLGPVLFTTVKGQKNTLNIIAWEWKGGTTDPWTRLEHVVGVSSVKDTLQVYLGKTPTDAPTASVKVYFIDSKKLRVETKILNHPAVNRIQMRFVDKPEDKYYGMGQRFYTSQHKRTTVRVWAEEKGIFGWFPHGKDMTYYPVPFFINPKGYGFLLDDVRYSEFDFNTPNLFDWDQALKLTNYNNSLNFNIYYGPTPLEVLSNFTEHTGRITHIPPAWAFAPWNVAVNNPNKALLGGINGSTRARQVADTVRKYKIPTSAIWSEDWWWGNLTKEAWELDVKAYPDYPQMIDELHQKGFKYLGYFLPYFSPTQSIYPFAASKGYFIKKPDGSTYTWNMSSSITDYKVTQLDVTNPEAVEWFTNTYMKKAESEYGIDGWMQDFGEYTPPDARFFNGSTGLEMHNQYSTLWIKMARDYFDKARPDGDYILFPRSGYTGTQRLAEMMVTGDHNANYDQGDGLPASITAMLSRGLSGASPIGGTDISSYFCWSKNADKQLFMRWVELGSLQPVMRSHRGTFQCNHWDFDKDKETLLHYKKYAQLHTALFPYFYTLTYEAKEKGWPLMRHLVLHYPDDPGSQTQDTEYLLGDRLLVAPVIVENATKRDVYFPPGEWKHFWSDKVFKGPGTFSVDAPIGQIPLFQKMGTILPLFNGEIETLVKENDPDLKGWDDANKSIEIRFAGYGNDTYRLWDGTVLNAQRNEGNAGDCSVSNATVARTYECNFIDSKKIITGIHKKESFEVVVFPNSFNNKITVTLTQSSTANSKVTVSDLLGHVVYKTEKQNTNFSLNLSFLESGIYTLTIETAEGVVTRKIIKN